jgi:class 3 adenylate cyclase
METPKTRYTKTADGVSIAYNVVGDGPFDLVFVPGVVSNVELAWELEPWRDFLLRLASFSRLINFDRRGVGLSDRARGMPPLEQQMDDVRAVLDAVGSERAATVGWAAGGAMLALFAGTYPERTMALVLYAAVPRDAWAPDYPWGKRPEAIQEWIEAPERRFGRDEDFKTWCETNCPTVADDEEYIRRTAQIFRLSSSPGSLADFRRTYSEIDVRHALSAIRVPTLVLHRTGDRSLDPAISRYVAGCIPGAVFNELPGIDQVPWIGDVESLVAAIAEFLVEVWEERPWEETESDRVLSTVLFTDIVGSTAKAIDLGDTRWRELLGEHHAIVRKQLLRFRGRELDTAGDGFFASFDGPARAIRCACAIRQSVRDLGLDVRAGLHTGECELIDGKIGGVAVHIGARVAGEAAAGEVLVSSTVRDLVAGSGLSFEDRGLHGLKGLGDWHLYAVLRD